VSFLLFVLSICGVLPCRLDFSAVLSFAVVKIFGVGVFSNSIMAEGTSATTKVLILGHSFIRRLERFVHERRYTAAGRAFSQDLWLKDCEVSWKWVSGGNVDRIGGLAQSGCLPDSDLVYLELGCNDILNCYSSSYSSEVTALRVLNVASLVKVRTGARIIILGEPLARVFDPPYIHYNEGLVKYLTDLRKEACEVKDLYLWRHAKLADRHCPQYFAPDGLHLSDHGHCLYYRSVRGAITAHLPKIS